MSDTRVAVVAGGSGGIGEGIVFALLTNDYTVYVPTREGDQSARLAEFVDHNPRLKLVPADLARFDQVESLRDRIVAAEGRIDAVIVSVGRYYYGYPMYRMPHEDWDQSIRDNLTTHFNLQRAFVSQMRSQNSGVYVSLTGPEADGIQPDEEVMSVMATAQRMMARVVAHEAFDTMVRVYAITARTGIVTRSRAGQINPDWISARDLGSYVVGLIRGQLPGIHDTVHELRDRKHLNAILDEVRRRTGS